MNSNNMIKSLIAGALMLTVVGCSSTNSGVKLDASPLMKLDQKMPSVAIGTDVHTDPAVIDAEINNGVGLAIPFIGVEAELGTLSVGPEKLNVSVGNDNSVTLGPLTLAQSLPAAKVGLSANKDKYFDLRLSRKGLGVTLPLVSLDIPSPKVSLDKSK
jgi:hypothetical protein